MKRITLICIAAASALAAGCGSGSSAPSATTAQPTSSPLPRAATMMIRHQMHGCHSWALNGGAYSPAQRTTLAVGGSLAITNDDVMPQKLVQSGGPAAALSGAAMGHMGARSTVTFPTAGVYTFTTKPGEDYISGVTTVGEDNVLKLRVIVR